MLWFVKPMLYQSFRSWSPLATNPPLPKKKKKKKKKEKTNHFTMFPASRRLFLPKRSLKQVEKGSHTQQQVIASEAHIIKMQNYAPRKNYLFSTNQCINPAVIPFVTEKTGNSESGWTERGSYFPSTPAAVSMMTSPSLQAQI